MRNGQNLLIKANRMFGAKIVDSNIIDLEDLETANSHFLEKLRSEDPQDASILKILLYDVEKLKEEDLLNYQIEEFGLGYCDLDKYNISEEVLEQINFNDCLSTWSMPIDCISGFWFVSSAYYLSPAVRKFWEESLDGDIIWYVSHFNRLSSKLDSLKKRRDRKRNRESSRP